ncbi:MAG: TonB-dependent receptor [Deltaproteobacteria bacterium]|nr:TonB-dependent receptor [Deltaproteobacteria bacterium]
MKKKRFMFFLIPAIGLFFALGDLSSTAAQESAAEEFTLEEITVTAQKREENQQKVPIAMEVLTGEDIREIGRNDIDEILNNISSVLTQSGDDGLRVSIRGISNDNNSFRMIQASAPTVAVNQDGVYSNRSGNNQSMYDVERVEVLFGPQSTLYASATPGGIVNIVTADPKTDKYEGSGTLEYGNYNLLHTEGSLNAPLNDSIALRVSFNTSVRDGYLSNGSADEDSKSARLKALFKTSDKFSFLITGEITRMGGQGFASAKPFDTVDGHWYDNMGPAGLVIDGEVDDPWTSAAGNAGRGRDQNRKKITGRIDWDLGIGILAVIPSYTKSINKSAGTTTDRGANFYTEDNGFGSEKGIEARMTSSADFAFKWIFGANMYKAKDEQHRIAEAQDEGVDNQYNDQWNDQDTKAIYANLTYPVTDRLRVSGGARYSWDENETINHEVPGKGGVAETWEGSAMEYNDPNYSIGAEYDLSDNSMLYGDIKSSYRLNAGGVAQKKADDPDWQMPPELLTAYTIGAKNRFFGNKLQLNVSAYYYDYQDYYANMPPSSYPVWNEETGTWGRGGELVNIATGDAVVYGADIQTSTIISSNDKLDFSVSYIKKYFRELIFDFPDVINIDFGLPDLDCADQDMPQAPNWKLSATYSHNFPLPNGASFRTSVDASYTSKTCLNWMAKGVNIDLTTGEAYTTDTTAVRWQDAYTMENASLTYTHSDGQWTLSAYINNIENYCVKRFLDGQGNMQVGNPRTYGGVLTVRF